MRKVYWVSRHDLSPAQVRAIQALHGQDAQIIKDPVVFEDSRGLLEYVREHLDGIVYAVAGAPHYIEAALNGGCFGIFENHPAKRADGTFGLKAVYHVVDRYLERVWENPDPLNDEGEKLAPAAFRLK